MTGATQFTANPASPAAAATGTSFSMAFAVTGAPSSPQSYAIDGVLPAGLSVPGATVNGTQRTLNARSGSISGTPAESGSFTIQIRAYEKNNRGGEKSPIYNYIINVTGPPATAPAFTAHPSSQAVTAGASVSLSVTVTGTPAPTLQWRKGGAPLAEQTGATLLFASITESDAGSYDCVATNTAGSATSNAATVTVNPATVAPAFTAHPSSQAVTAGASISLSVTVTGSPAPTLQWRKGGAPLAGQTGATLLFASITEFDAGSYDCVATNTAGSATSNAAVITISAPQPPQIVTQPIPIRSLAGTGAYFSVAATGNGGSLRFQWKKGGVDIDGATLSSIFIPAVGAGDAGAYSVVVSDENGEVTSSAAALTVASTGSSRLINMSTRAGVGIGDGSIIPGFVIEGDVSLTVLVRAAGPALLGYGVENALGDPVMSLYRGGWEIGSNDDWEQAPDVPALQSAMTSVGAFPLEPGSRDSALLVALNPGVYSVVVSGKAGVTGVALVEFYVVGDN
jgi:hypothetical protein